MNNTGDDDLEKPLADSLDLMPSVLKVNQTWVDLFDVFTQVMDTQVEDPIRQLESIRFINRNTDDNILRYTARLLGFDLSQDVLNLNAENLTKIVSQLAMYPDQNGTELFIKFIDLAMNSVTSVDYLYTKDYVNFYTQPEGKLLIDGGEWFKTTHIDLNIELRSLDSLVLSNGQTLYGRVKELFFNFAPVALVIDHLYFVITFEDKDWLGGQAFGLGVTMPYVEASVIID